MKNTLLRNYSYIVYMHSFTLNIPHARSWTDDDLFEFCVSNKEMRIERDAKGFIIIMSPSGGLSSHYIFKLAIKLGTWNEISKKGICFESSGGFLLSDGSMRAPDIAFVSKSSWNNLSKKEKNQFPPLCPEFVIEVRSMTDRLPVLQTKMGYWIENGCQLAWLIDPQEEKVYIYRPSEEVEIVTGFSSSLSGEKVLPEFSFDLSYLKEE